MILTIPFSKFEGAKNDFILIDDREGVFPPSSMHAFSRQACHRRTGIGADGVIFIQESDRHDFRMLFFNPDGSDGSMCGNGGRCAVLFASRLGIGQGSVSFEVLGQEYRGEFLGNSIRLRFPEPDSMKRNIPLPLGEGNTVTVHFVHTGAPHAVLFFDEIGGRWKADSLDALNVRDLGALIRGNACFSPAGANVNFLSMDADGIVRIRTFEKGVEAETESCGTGTIASALVAALAKNLSAPVTLRSHGGDTLRVGFERTGEEFREVYLEGPARRVFDGIVRFDTRSETLTTEETA